MSSGAGTIELFAWWIAAPKIGDTVGELLPLLCKPTPLCFVLVAWAPLSLFAALLRLAAILRRTVLRHKRLLQPNRDPVSSTRETGSWVRSGWGGGGTSASSIRSGGSGGSRGTGSQCVGSRSSRVVR